MKYLITLFFFALVQTQFNVFAETEEEEMARYQKKLNSDVFGMNEKPVPKPESEPTTKLNIPQPAAKVEATADSNSSIPLSSFTNYKLAGVSIGKEEQSVIDSLTSQGYNCNAPQMAKMLQLTGKKICIYLSSEDPKMAMIGFSGGKLHDLETHETYTTSFPEKFFKKAKDKFMAKYGNEANCKAKGKGELCEVFGHGYRVIFRTELERNGEKAKIINRIARM